MQAMRVKIQGEMEIGCHNAEQRNMPLPELPGDLQGLA